MFELTVSLAFVTKKARKVKKPAAAGFSFVTSMNNPAASSGVSTACNLY
jgi:hypothetical protein